MLGRHAYTLQAEPLLDGDAGTAQTIARIRELVEQGKRDPYVNHFTGTLLRNARVRSFDDEEEIRAIFAGVLRHVRFQKDPEGKECLRPARTTLEWGFGDCDDINAILLPAMLGTVGYRTRIVTVASHPAAPGQFTHVYCEVYFRGRWIAVDAARRGARLGLSPEQTFRKRIWSIDDPSFVDVQGLGCGNCGGRCMGCAMRTVSGLGTHFRLGRNYRAKPIRPFLRGMGQDGFDWSSFASVINSAGNAVASGIRAANAPAIPVYPSSAAYPAGVVPGVLPPAGGVVAAGSISSTTLLLGGAALAVIVLALRR